MARSGCARSAVAFGARAEDEVGSALHGYHEETEDRYISRKDACVAPYSVEGSASVLVVEERRAVYARDVSEGACM